MSDFDCDVLIVGFGPVGAVLAGLLGKQGHQVVAIDRSHDIYPFPRAGHFDHETMRVFQQLGITDSVLPHTRVPEAYEFRAADRQILFYARSESELAISGWASSYMFNQPPLERQLRKRVKEFSNVGVRLGVEFKKLTQSDQGVTVTVRDDSGADTALRSRFVVGCDGAWSPVRESLGIGLVDLEFDEPWLVIDAIPKDGSQLPTVNLQICDPERPTTCIPLGPNRHRWEFMMLPGETRESVLEESFVERLLQPWNADVEIERKAVYRFHGLVAEKWRDDRVMIAGDAAHQMPPFAGQGMCSGIRDAANLAWKLDAILSGGANEDILSSYQEERDPNIRDYIRLSMDMGKVVCILDPEIAAQRDRQMIAKHQAGKDTIQPATTIGFTSGIMVADDPDAGKIFPQFTDKSKTAYLRLDDAMGDGVWLISTTSGMTPQADNLVYKTIDDPDLAPFREPLVAWLSERNVEAVMVRPDRYIFGIGDTDFLIRSWDQALQGQLVEGEA